MGARDLSRVHHGTRDWTHRSPAEDPACDSSANLPQVKYWQVWNEPNLFQFLNPQFNASGDPVCLGSIGRDVKRRSLEAFQFPFVAFAHNGRVSAWGRIPPDAVAGSPFSGGHRPVGGRRSRL
jgi:hypothetical protein